MSKTQIDKIGERLRTNRVDAEAIEALDGYRSEFTEAYKAVEKTLRDRLGHTVTGRPAKSTIAIVEKLKRQKSRLTQIQDIAGCRVIVGNAVEQDSLVEAVRVMFDDVAVDDKRSDPTNGYRAVHLVVRINGKQVEVQIRTRLQHLWAEVSEKLADTFGHEIKYGSGDKAALEILGAMSHQIRRVEDAHEKLMKLMAVATRPSLGQKRVGKKHLSEMERNVRLEFYKLRALLARLQV